MHEELREELQTDSVEILAVNEIGYDNFEYVTTVSSQLPWVQDVEEVNAWELWEITYRDLVILDQDNIFLTTYNLTDNPMWTTTLGTESMPNESYVTLKNIFRHVALYDELPPEPDSEDAGMAEESDGGTDAVDSGAWLWPPDDTNDGPVGPGHDAGDPDAPLTADAGNIQLADAGASVPTPVIDSGIIDSSASFDAGDDTSWEFPTDAGQNTVITDAGPITTQQAVDSGALYLDENDSGFFLESLDGAVATVFDAGQPAVTNPMSDFYLPDGNPYSPSQGTYFSPRDNLGKVSAYYFGSGG